MKLEQVELNVRHIWISDEWILVNFRVEMDRLRISITPSDHLPALLRLALRQKDFIFGFETYLESLDMILTRKMVLLIRLAESCRSTRQRADVLDMKRSMILGEIESPEFQLLWRRLSNTGKVNVLRSLENPPNWAFGSAKDFARHFQKSLSMLIDVRLESDFG